MSINRRAFLKNIAGAASVPLLLKTNSVLANGRINIKMNLQGNNWLAFLPDHLKLNQLTIPGTHDSGSLYGGGLAQTQKLTIAQQLQAGVRYLDIRICLRGGATGTFYIHHGIIYQHQTFTDVLNTVNDFLQQNPSETVMLCLKQENSSESDPVMGVAYQNHIKPFKHRVIDNGKIVTLGQARGKMVIVSRCLGIPGINYRRVQVLDNYQITTRSQWYREKWVTVKAHLYHVSQEPLNNDTLWITTTSSTGAFLWPNYASYLMQPALKQYFEQQNISKPMRYGIVLTDFVTSQQAEMLASLNFGRLHF